MPSRIPALCSALVSAVAALSVPADAQPDPELVTNPTELVNPFIGTGSGGEHVGSVNTFPGAVAPFGMLSRSPETTSRPAGGGYEYGDSATTGLSVTHLSGVGCPIQGDLPILPTTGEVTGTPMRATQPFRHADERTGPGSYSTVLGDITTRVATSTRAGIGQFGFPATDRANVLFKAGGSQTANTAASMRISGPDTVIGSISGGHFCEQANTYTAHFAAVFDRPFTATGTFQDSTVTPGGTAVDGPRAGAWSPSTPGSGARSV